MKDLLRRREIRVSVLGALLALGCSVASTEYRGTYTRTWLADHGGTEQTSGDVRLVLTEDGRYRIHGDGRDAPPTREGRYRRQGDTIILTDSGPGGGGYDQSLILTGSFVAAEEDGTLVLTQDTTWGDTHLLILENHSKGF